MSKLFIFAIGGTGSRVIKSLTMLLASGIDLKNTSEIIPIIVDPHKANHDLKRTEEILGNYRKIRDAFKPNEVGDFFHTEIKKLKDIASGEGLEDSYTFQLQGVNDETFKDYIGYNELGSTNQQGEELYAQNKDLINLLFSDSQLNTHMDIGFVGNPNIGSVVLNQFKNSVAFKHFASNFAQGDRIFIISSIFGGTGAAGFPIILKNIRGAEAGDIENPEYLRNAIIGAISVQPYFGLEPKEEKRVDKATFYSKTKAALQYYMRGVNKSVDRLYYIGDEKTSNFAYDPGEGGQKNDAHFIELAAATAIIDFANTPDNDFDGEQGRRFMLKDNVDILNFNNLTSRSKFTIGKALSKFTTFCMYLNYSFKDKVGGTNGWINDNPKLDNAFIQGTFYHDNIKSFIKSFVTWIEEMEKNKRAFKPFNLGEDLTHLIVDHEPKKGFLNLGAPKASFDDVDDALNKYSNGKTFSSQEVRLLKTFSKGLDAFLAAKFPNI